MYSQCDPKFQIRATWYTKEHLIEYNLGIMGIEIQSCFCQVIASGQGRRFEPSGSFPIFTAVLLRDFGMKCLEYGRHLSKSSSKYVQPWCYYCLFECERNITFDSLGISVTPLH